MMDSSYAVSLCATVPQSHQGVGLPCSAGPVGMFWGCSMLQGGWVGAVAGVGHPPLCRDCKCGMTCNSYFLFIYGDPYIHESFL